MARAISSLTAAHLNPPPAQQQSQKLSDLSNLLTPPTHCQTEPSRNYHQSTDPKTTSAASDQFPLALQNKLSAANDLILSLETGTFPQKSDPHPALASLVLGLSKEKALDNDTKKHLSVIGEKQDLIDKLLQALRQIPAATSSKLPLSEGLKKELQDLKVDLSSYPKELKTDDLARLRSTLNAELDKHRQKVSEIFTTKIQTTQQIKQAILDILKSLVRQWEKTSSEMTRKQIAR